MNRKNAFAIAAGVLLGFLAAWWLGLFDHPAEPAAQTAAATKAPPNPLSSNPPAKINLRMAVAAPRLPPVPASDSSPPPPGPAQAGAGPYFPPARPMDDASQQSRIKAITNNLRQLSAAADQYMLDKGLTSAGYYDLVGSSTDNYIRSVNPVLGEDYTGFYVTQDQTQVTIVAPDGTIVTYNM